MKIFSYFQLSNYLCMIVSKIIYENGDKELVRLECQKWEFISDTISTVKVNPGDCL